MAKIYVKEDQRLRS